MATSSACAFFSGKAHNSPSETDPRGPYPLHVAAEFGQAAAVLLEHGADDSLLDRENDTTALGWAAFFGRLDVVESAQARICSGFELYC